MNTDDDPERYIRDLERGVSQTPGTPQPFGTPSDASGAPGEISRRRLPRVANLAINPRRRTVLILAVAATLALAAFLANHYGKTTVQGHLIMINGGAKDTIDCNNGNLELDGDNNTYTVTGHCLRLDIRGSANKVTVDSADTIGVIGDDNAVIYHSGAPTINKTGNNNIVSERLSNR
ncbi:DUF3060 domain-containing protein [Mycobacterium sp. 1081908.1]|uniref:DUF3060 domain-containing protein n=1 Tax=Mycobacterium sp. 1081908.1 TaxID=1834066 RepID=UPI0007FC2990|nr:DUF3060 domain-containing protein [Mycobacterium sp. 1081908.1]OBK49638.1 hypothetical protein A5655_01630 [Mycobacterium sp. 1081908.1]